MSFDYTINTDGGSRGNPGISGAGAVIYDVNGEVLKELSKPLGINTNNFAEYSAVILGLENLKHIVAEGDRQETKVEVKMDSELIVEQLAGNYKVKSDTLRPLFEKVEKIKKEFPHLKFTHVRRENNKEADALANRAMDEQD